jgi:hypothetical protein
MNRDGEFATTKMQSLRSLALTVAASRLPATYSVNAKSSIRAPGTRMESVDLPP